MFSENTVYTPENIKEIEQAYNKMLGTIQKELSKADKILVGKAYEVALKAHRFQSRKSGEPYIMHPIAVARIVSEDIGLGPVSVAAALIHDVVEDSDEYSIVDIEVIFGRKIANIIDGLTKIPKIEGEDISHEARNIRKILITLSEDPRIVFIKLADRLHNMRTMGAQKPASQKRISLITQYVFIPLAHRMGLYSVKSELEDLCLKYIEPEIYNSIKEKINKTKQERNADIEEVIKTVYPGMVARGITCLIKGRAKSISGIYQKMQRQNVDFEEVYDQLAIRVIIDMAESPRYNNDPTLACFAAFTAVSDYYRPSGKRFRNFVVNPKSNGYQSLHETFSTPDGKWVEVQIRTIEMDEIAEKGLASHWSYKETQSNQQEKENKNINLWYNKIREHLENPERDAGEFLDDIKYSLYSKEITVFSPKGDVVILPKGASVLDFAFEIHTELGAKCTGAKINGKMVSFRHELQNGDVIEILKSENQIPKADWLNLVKTSKARNKIKQSLNATKKQTATYGKEILQRKLKALKIDFNDRELQKIQNFFKLKTSHDLFYKIGTNEIDNKALRKFKDDQNQGFVGFIRKKLRKEDKKGLPTPQTFEKPILQFGDNQSQVEFTLSPCCNPVPGDAVFGVTRTNGGMKVHKYTCPNAKDIQARFSHKIRKAEWIEGAYSKFRAELEINGVDRDGIAHEVGAVVFETKNVTLQRIHIWEDHGIFRGKIAFEVSAQGVLDELIATIKKVNGVKSVIRKK
ncbi:MAG: RelA/SpoT family protein [Flavobacteriales bacterium]|jgi:GTP pyrophosphokinase|nr:RelA/SpoT family protein [Flavobacteriales bacterium]